MNPSELAESALVRPPPPLELCRNCGAVSAQSFCGACGQRRYQGRITLGRVMEQVWTEVSSLDRGLLHTFLALWYRPGGAIREYLDGKTVSYTSPAKYLLIVVAVTTFLFFQVGQFETLETRLIQTANQHPAAMQLLLLMEGAASKYLNLLIIFGVPFATLWSYLLFRREGLNWAEHLIFNLYTYSQQSVLYTIVALLLLLPIAQLVPQVLGGIAMVVYYVWATVGFFGGKRGSVGARAVLAIGLSVLSYTVAGAGMVAGYLLLY